MVIAPVEQVWKVAPPVSSQNLNITSIEDNDTNYDMLRKRGLAEIISSKMSVDRYQPGGPTKEWPNGKSMTYSLNSKGYRSTEFSKDTDLIFAGCSYTYATGLQDEYIWGNILADSLKMSRSNLGMEGWSTQAIVKNLFAYFEEYGNPKILVCLFPDLQRMMTLYLFMN